MYKITTATKKVATLSKRIRAIQGGTSASKTISILLLLIHKAQTDKIPTLTSIVSESVPHLKRGAMRDFRNIMVDHKYWNDDYWNATDSIYRFETGSKIEFFSSDNADKLRGSRRDRLFINEANNVSFDSFEQLEVRTKEFVFLDWNPSIEFWFYTEILNKRDDVEHIVLTYIDNEGLSKEIIDSIEQRRERKGWWKVYGEGQLGEVDGKIYKDWQIIDEINHYAKLERYGIDFGYSNDPTSVVAIYKYDGGYIFDEIAYQKGLSNKQIADILLNQQQALCIADSAEPKSIDEIKSFGLTILGADKGKDSVNYGIQIVQDQKISVTKRSVNIIREYRNYLWMIDKNGKILNEPEHTFSHCFAPETLVHTIKGKIRIDKLVGKEGYLYSKDGYIERFYGVKKTRLNADVITLYFNDRDLITITPDHLLLLPNGEWIEARLLCTSDMIQSDIYEQNIYIQWIQILSICGFAVLQRVYKWKEMVVASLYMDNRTRGNTKKLSHPPQGREQREQYNRQSRTETQVGTFGKPYDNPKKEKSFGVGRCDKTAGLEVAWVKTGKGMAQVTWEENIRVKKANRERVRTLPQYIFNNTLRKICKILSSKLQNESKTKTITRIVRGFRKETYNLEVENTHCLIANGVVAHNSMDALRYGMASLHKKAPPINTQQSAPLQTYYPALGL